MVGPLTRWSASTLGAALLCSSRAGSDLGLVSRWVKGFVNCVSLPKLWYAVDSDGVTVFKMGLQRSIHYYCILLNYSCLFSTMFSCYYLTVLCTNELTINASLNQSTFLVSSPLTKKSLRRRLKVRPNRKNKKWMRKQKTRIWKMFLLNPKGICLYLAFSFSSFFSFSFTLK